MHGNSTRCSTQRRRPLIDSFDTIRLTRKTDNSAGGVLQYAIVHTPSALGVDVPVANITKIEIADYFDLKTLDRKDTGELEPADATTLNATTATVADPLTAMIDRVGDTVCEVSYTTTLAVVQKLNEAGVALPVSNADNEIIRDLLLVDRPQALAGIRIDSRFSSLGTGKLVSDLITAGMATKPADDKRATGEGSFAVTIRCTDRDATAEVTGTVVVQDA